MRQSGREADQVCPAEWPPGAQPAGDRLPCPLRGVNDPVHLAFLVPY